MTRTPTPTRAGHGHPWLTLLAVSLGLMMVALDGTVVSIANPTIGRDLHASLAGLQWVTNGYLLAIATTLVIGGKLGDLFGRKKMFLLGVVAFTLASLGCGVSSSIGMLIAFRVAQGFGGALMMPGTLSILRTAFPPQKLQMAVGVWAGSTSLATASGPIVGGLLVQHVSWQSIFYINLGVGAVALAVGWWVIAESRDESKPKLDFLGSALLGGSLFCLIWGIIKAEEHGWSSAYTLGFLAASAVLFAVFLGWMVKEQGEALVPLDLFKVPDLNAGLVVMLTVMFSLYGVLFFITLYLQRVQGYSPVEAGVRMLPLTGVMAVSAPLGGFLGMKLPGRVLMGGGMALVTGALLGLTGIAPHSGFGSIWPWFLMMAFGMGFVFTSASQAIVGSAPHHRAGLASGLQQTLLQVGGVLGTSVLGAILTSRIGSLLPSRLEERGVTGATADAVVAGRTAIAQGVVPVPTGSSAATSAHITDASFAALTTGMHTTFVIAAVITAIGAVVAAIWVRTKPGAPMMDFGGM